MTDTLHLEIITAGGAVVDTPAAQITLPLADGEVGILPGHAPLLGALMCGVVRYPNATTYSAGGNPFFGAGCGCGCGAAF